ncbi:MAG: glutamyl-tRNA(Gln) amidotransferase, B subunit, aspartyl-tRNA(Asn)/glutamyl-tRNA (Gln) amidotransferase subunit B [Microgenomates group bacterium GW2011_GWC1_46_16]|uniref:Aspartyl/glutamyl-tRNA(Asn/Gln) amidotransferase subunit B n=1 Tax=Candidatus Collierbacteria bacterium RIFOXYD1_FULL_46_26 TaxID=1817732 RepID=A0A1F5FYE9_9BACT|nr:MAG: Aspartyl/glutamyl-tRNA(Asn/Gln) amidotransferase subunit B [Microgenomates group bacterium GW2011_GWF1_46_12]KKU26520.1 MAG: glutamyl-tRNA(Gln) amidotransferase, B subunit, aspartyl-tRNA(Asn)/glutamyl-tRNA (Gln) amidotransferase subunit B [Microgenomates group bacterium GW2011_GWC1_46_16]KKU28217.1 MAG: Aspartyl/glutamyl-tRNA(Asn/Gln) amidotransferase subunit B [Microgenomates group bacterium GW2011_GWF2_46_18]KKU45138.1 MAG: Aspartyl/glutamyl-tRNA(Asn/Gln) amidotransferase subunit B [Mi
MTYQLICGAEIHVELKTKSKMFCGCQNDPFHAPKPNLYTCPVCLGLPGALPVPNQKAIEDTILLGLALHSQIAKVSKFDRKHYFYPDLPKGYQISQYDQPLCIGGYLDTSFGRVNLTRIHLEEDTAKLQHATVNGQSVSLIDFNRSSVPLMEIVTEPDIKSPEMAKEFLKGLRDIIRALGIADCDMEKGGMRLEANISLTKDGTLPHYKVEVKNINSFRFFANSLDYEFQRQSEILDKGEIPAQETRGYRSTSNLTVSQRTKEDAADYRYFPDPDIPPLIIDSAWVSTIQQRLRKLPNQIITDLVSAGITESAAKIILQDPDMLTFITQVKILDPKSVRTAGNDLANKKIDYHQITPEAYLEAKKSNVQNQISANSQLEPLVRQVLADNPELVAQYRAGKTGILGFFVGAVIKNTGGKADPRTVTELLKKNL